jgi:hypothetical protein
MEFDSRNKLVIVASIVCLIAAIVIVFMWLKPENPYKGLEGQSMWLMCRNAECNNTWQMKVDAFLKYEKENMNPNDPISPVFQVCPKCGQKTGSPAIKCPKCETVFFEGSAPAIGEAARDIYRDRCPKCGYSQIEDRVEAAKPSKDN